MMSIRELSGEIRQLANIPVKKFALFQDPSAWNMLTSCLDVILDTELSIDAFLKPHDIEEDGEQRLLIYGILQSLFVQQDAVKNLTEALKIYYSPPPLLAEIREARNDSIGHPTKRGGGSGKTFNSIVGVNPGDWRFILLVAGSTLEEPELREINILDLIEQQRAALITVLAEVVAKLKRSVT